MIYKSPVCRIGLSDDNIPYIVPMCFGFKDNTIYIEQKRNALNIIMNQYSEGTFEFPENAINKTSVIKITGMTGKQLGYS